MTASWYGKTPAKHLQNLIETKPKLVQLLAVPQFPQELKSYNTKLLDYVTNNPPLIGEAIELIITPPLFNDSNDRKYKYPLQAVQIIEAQTTCILNSFFKEASPGTHYFDTLFNILHQPEILPLLAGYFFRTNICLLNNRYKETLDRVYLKAHLLNQLINHASQMPICNTIQLYLNLDINKSSESDPSRLEVKKQLLKKILNKIQTERKLKRPDSSIIIENLMTVLIQTIEKYYLILDGKTLVQILTSQQCIETMMALIKENWEGAYPAFNFFISLINYYSFSSFNADQTDPQKKLKNLQRLEAQPMVIGLRYYFPIALDKITKAPLMTLYEYKLLEVLCHCISISSEEILKTIKETRFFSVLITLLFKHQENNILHMLIQKSFLHVFISERKVYEQYKRHLFCQIDIIELTATRVLNQYDETKIFEGLKKKTCFGHFMRILKIYSGIQTTQESIINAIKAKTEVWNKISTHLIKPYEAISFKELGSYEGIPEGKLQEFQVKKSSQPQNLLITNAKPLTNSMIEEIRKQDEHLPTIKKQVQAPKIVPEILKEELIQEKKKQEELLKAPTHNLTIDFKSEPHREIKKAESFKDFMSKKKVQAEQEIRLKRSLSHEKKLSGSKGKMTGPSPKKNSWTEKSEESVDGSKTDALMTKMNSSSVSQSRSGDMPRIPHYIQNTSLNFASTASKEPSQSTQMQQNSSVVSGYRSYYGSSIQQSQSSKTQPSTSSSKEEVIKGGVEIAKSDKNGEILKKIRVIRIDAPKEKKYRRVEQKDKVFLDFLGIPTVGK